MIKKQNSKLTKSTKDPKTSAEAKVVEMSGVGVPAA